MLIVVCEYQWKYRRCCKCRTRTLMSWIYVTLRMMKSCTVLSMRVTSTMETCITCRLMIMSN